MKFENYIKKVKKLFNKEVLCQRGECTFTVQTKQGEELLIGALVQDGEIYYLLYLAYSGNFINNSAINIKDCSYFHNLNQVHKYLRCTNRI